MTRSALCLLFVACATPSATGSSASALARDASQCERFSTFDAELERAALSDGELKDHAVALRERCATAVLTELQTFRERFGAEATQRELDAMALSLGGTRFTALAETIGVDAALKWMVAIAVANADIVRHNESRRTEETKALDAWKPTAPADASQMTVTNAMIASLCRSPDVRIALACFDERSKDDPNNRAKYQAAAVERAQSAVKELRALPVDERARALASAAQQLEKLEAPTTVIDQALAELWKEASLELLREAESGSLDQAALAAEPYARVPQARDAVTGLKQRAAARHDALATDAGARAFAATLHRKWAERFGGPTTSWPDLSAEWNTSRWACSQPFPAMKKIAHAMQLRVIARCTVDQNTQFERSQDPSMRTFDTERELKWLTVTGDVVVTCAGTTKTFPLQSKEPLLEDQLKTLDAFVQRTSALGAALESIATRAAQGCRDARKSFIAKDCAHPQGLDFEQRMTEHALSINAWPDCFRNYALGVYGITPPDLPAAH